MTDNRTRIFGEILSVDAWHTQFSDSNQATVHAELAFKNGRIGGDDFELPFTFSVSLRRAVVTIRVEPPLQIIKRSVARGVPDSEIELTKFLKVREGAASTFAAKGGVNLQRFSIAMSGSTKRENEVTFEEQAKVMEKVPPILIRPQPGGNHEYRWELEPSYLMALEGQPWHAVDAPRLMVKSRDALSEPIIKMFISCKREDLDVYDLKLKDDNFDAKLSQLIYKDMNTAAAIQYVKHLLEIANLEPNALDNRFSSLILADIIVTPEMLDD